MLIMCLLHFKVIATFDCCKIIIIIIVSNSNGISSSSNSNITLNISGKRSLKKKKSVSEIKKKPMRSNLNISFLID